MIAEDYDEMRSLKHFIRFFHFVIAECCVEYDWIKKPQATGFGPLCHVYGSEVATTVFLFE